MERLRNLGKTPVFKFFLFFVASTFVIFGIAEFIFGNSKYNVARIGSHDISVMKFNVAVQKYRDIISRQNPNKETMTYLKSKQFKLEVLDDMVANHLLDESSSELGLRISENLIIDYIIKDPRFLDEDGKFNQASFNNLLSSNRITESEYFDRQKTSLTAYVFNDIFSYIGENNTTRVEDLNKYRNETRIADVITISEKSLQSKPTYTQEELKEYYEANTSLYTLPSMKQVSYIEIKSEDIRKNVNIEEDKIQSHYNDNKSNFIKQESRDVYVLYFEDEIKAQEVRDSINSKESFLEQGKILNKSEEELLVKGLTHDRIFKELSDPIFNSDINTITNVIAVEDNKFYIIYINNIDAQRQLAYTEVKEQIKDSMINEIVETKISSLLSALENDILGANNLEELAKKYNLTAQTTVDFSKSATDVFNQANEILVKTSFDLSEGDFSEIISLPNEDVYVLLFNKKDTASRVQTFIEVESKIAPIIQKQKIIEAIEIIANNMHKQIQRKMPIENIVVRNNAKIEKDVELIRNSSEIAKASFKININNATKPIMTDGAYQIAIVKNIKSADANATDKINQELQEATARDLFNSYEMYMRIQNPVKVHMNNVDMIQ